MRIAFDRQHYLPFEETFETRQLEDAEKELQEFKGDPVALAFELAYTRYALAKAERTLDRFRHKCLLAEDENAEMRSKLGRLSVWSVDMIDMLTKALGADVRGTWSAGMNDSLHSELRQAARQYGGMNKDPKTLAFEEFVDAIEWVGQCEDFWKAYSPVEDNAFWRCWETTMDEALQHHDQAYKKAMAFYK